ncbi:MAG: DUF3568 family protein [Opitutales bacterium]|nr:DUF3568 family protein [Opitutales bacterium]MCH8539152.1 DUF3568 domain-containing protein [Opitutales bacterium]
MIAKDLFRILDGGLPFIYIIPTLAFSGIGGRLGDMKYSTLQKRIVLGFLPLLAFAFSGCVAVVAGGVGAGTVAYVRGDLQTKLEEPHEAVFEASLRAVDSLGFALVEQKGDAVSGEIVARTSQDRRVRIQTKEESAETTGLSIRIGTFGDEELSRRILREIEGNL